MLYKGHLRTHYVNLSPLRKKLFSHENVSSFATLVKPHDQVHVGICKEVISSKQSKIFGCRYFCSNQARMASSGDQAGSEEGKCQFIKEEVVASAKWLQLNQISWRDRKGRERLWECAGRTTRKADLAADAVAVIPVLKRNLHFDFVICIKQYRPPLKAYTLEFPAGLIDNGETPEVAALRELKEETGYVATVKHVSPATSLDPGSENCTLVFAAAEVNGDLPENIHPKQELEESEDIEVVLLPLSEILQKVNEMSKDGIVVDSNVYSYAIATSMALLDKPKEIKEN